MKTIFIYKQIPEDVANAKKNAILRIVANAIRRQKHSKKEVIEAVKK